MNDDIQTGAMPPITPAEEITSVETAAEEAAEEQVPTPVASPPAPPPPPAAPAAAPPASEPAAPLGGSGVSVPPPPPPAPEGALPPAPTAPPVAPAAAPKVMPEEWPCAGYTGPQPWEADNPPALTQNHLMLSAGASGDEVVELASHLAYLGYATSISAGQNPHAIYDTGVSDAVRAFCAEYGVAEDPKVRQARTEDTVGPWLWEALVRAVHKKLAEQGS